MSGSLRAPRLIRADSVLKTAEHGVERRCGDSNRITRLAEELKALCDEAGGDQNAFTPATLLELAQYRSPVPVSTDDGASASRRNDAARAAYEELVESRARACGPRGRQVTVDPQAFSDMLIYMRNKEANSALREAVRNHAAFRSSRSKAGSGSSRRRGKARRSNSDGGDSESLLADQVAWLVKRARCNDELQSFLLAAKALVCRATLGSGGITGTVVESSHLAKELRRMAEDSVVTQAEAVKRAEDNEATYCRDKFDLGTIEGDAKAKKVEGPPTCLRLTGRAWLEADDASALQFGRIFRAHFMVRVRSLDADATLLHASSDGSNVRCAALPVV